MAWAHSPELEGCPSCTPRSPVFPYAPAQVVHVSEMFPGDDEVGFEREWPFSYEADGIIVYLQRAA